MKYFFTIMIMLTLVAVDAVNAQTSLNTSYLGKWGFGGSSPMFTRGNHGFFFSSGTMHLFDIADREHLRRIGEYDVPMANPKMFDSLIIGTGGGGIMIANINDPAVPSVSSLTLSVPPQDYAVHKNLLFVAAQGEGLIIYDIADQHNPIVKTTFKTAGSAFDIAVAQDYVYVGTLPTGIEVIRWSDMDSLQGIGFSKHGIAEQVRVYNDTVYVSAGLGDVWMVRYNNGTSVQRPAVTDDDYRLQQNYPNPFNPSTAITYSMRYSGRVTITIYDLLGREAGTILDEYKQSGTYTVPFDAQQLAGGVYYYRLVSGNYRAVKKMMLVK